MQKFPPPHFPIILETIRQILNENVNYLEGFLIGTSCLGYQLMAKLFKHMLSY